MELQSPVMAKKLWNFLRMAVFMMRKGLISKRKLLLDMNLMMKKGRYLTKSWSKNLAFHNQSNSHLKTVLAHPIDGITVASGDYEFSCSNTPSPSFHFKAAGSTSKRRQHVYFPCIGSIVEENDEPSDVEIPTSLPQIDYLQDACDSIRVSNYSAEDEGEGTEDGQVDVDAEDFIRKFYEQLRAQRRVQLLEYSEKQFEDLVAGERVNCFIKL